VPEIVERLTPAPATQPGGRCIRSAAYVKKVIDSVESSDYSLRTVVASPTPADDTTRPDPSPDRPAARTPNPIGQLIDLVRKLMDYGANLAATLHQRAAANDLSRFTHVFGTRDIALIMARITRGLLLATALQARLIARIDRKERVQQPTGTTITSAAPPRKPRTAPRAPRREWQPDPRLAGMPTAEEIAAEVRRRPVGAVIADICRDLGILPASPLWRELSFAIMTNGGCLVRLFRDSWKHLSGWKDDLPPDVLNARLVPYPPPAAVAHGTGPP
jgi:hypothetical protein